MKDLSIVILAAGQGTRMKSALPKVLQPLAGEPFIIHVLNTALKLLPKQVVLVVGHGAELVKATVGQYFDLSIVPIEFVLQEQQLGTGHAVCVALDSVKSSQFLVMYGDVPLVKVSTYSQLLERTTQGSLGVLTAQVENPFGLGRIVRDTHNAIVEIVEEKDANVAQKQISEVNTGIFVINTLSMQRWAKLLSNNNAQKEYYLTDIVKLTVGEGGEVMSHTPSDVREIQGINDRAQQMHCERDLQKMKASELMQQGVQILDANRIDIRGTLECESDVVIDVNVVFEGHNKIAKGAKIGPFCFIRDCIIGPGVEILPHCHLDGAVIGKNSTIGPFARIRPQTVLAEKVKIGNFVEIKKSQVAYNSKISHLSYIGDATIGADVNIGAGTITCNYDGVNKYQTIIEDGAFIGSDTQLVAPVTVGKNATIGAGSTLTRDAAADMLTLSRTPQKTIQGWKRPHSLEKDKTKH